MTKNIREFLQMFSTAELKQKGILQEKERNLLRHDSIKPLITLMKEHGIDKLEYPAKNWFFDVDGNFSNLSSPTLKEGNIRDLENPGNIFKLMNSVINPHYKKTIHGARPERPEEGEKMPGRIDNQTLHLLKQKKQIILYGPPGTGKTYNTKELALKILSGDLGNINSEYERYRREGRIDFITFHPSYSYEEFIEGITVETESENIATNNIKYKLRPGMFKRICKRAIGKAVDPSDKNLGNKTWADVFNGYLRNRNAIDFNNAPPSVLIIDEINRGEIAKIFGELITLLESDKRLGEDNELIVKLPASNDDFCIPPNLFIIATMNTADRSIALLDVALRRRFGFIEMNPDFDVLLKHADKNQDRLDSGAYDLLVESVKAAKKINYEISRDKAIGRDKQIGHSFFFKVESPNDIAMVWRYEILPLLEEYCYGDYLKLNQILFHRDTDTSWISQTEGIKELDNTNVKNFLNDVLG